MSSTKNNKSRYRDGCIGSGYKALKNNFLSNLFRKLTFKSGRSQDTTNNSSLTNSDLTNSIINYDTKIQTPQKIKIKSGHNQSLKIDDSVIDNLKNNENIAEKNFDPLTQNVNIQTFNNTTSNSKNSTNKNYDYIHYCNKCGHQKLHSVWCEQCEREIFKSDFPNWTSGNKIIDNFIQETQLSATTKFNFLEWIPFSSLTNIKPIGKGGFSEVFSAKWIDGPRTKWNVEKKVWERYSNVNVALKCLLELKEEDFTNELFKELKSHLISNDQVVGRFNILHTYGMTRDPNSKVYMMVMTLADDGDLSSYMKKHFSTLTFIRRLEILYDIATGLYQIHKSGLMHRQMTPSKKDDNQVFGVLPYIAPEILCNKPYTQAADIYSFGILMWEILTGLKAFGDIIHDSSLMLDIFSGLRPDIPINTPKLYADLMKRCWNNNVEKRPKFKRGDELLKMTQLQTLHPNNVLYSTFHDTKALSMKLDNFQ
ncbi:kinase-like domain-containing protein [Gigaspora rosea]|uniref:Kinase-like domain-containing protein n=1 Tax=Gigaspora rosea TaxID=44941 RepID=A0A397VK88_9GLOM|nr:kinase-like domain-containing protein [Gigaspora rosea]